MNLYILENQMQQALLKNTVERYKQRQPQWFNDVRVKKTILTDVFWSWQNLGLIATFILVAIGLLLILTTYWIVATIAVLLVIMGGVLLEISWLWISLNRKDRQTKAISKLLSPQVTFSLDSIYDKQLKAKLFKSLHYWALINEKSQSIPPGALHTRLAATCSDITRWLQRIYQVVQRADQLQRNGIIKQDLHKLPAAIQDHEERLRQETNPQTQQHLQQILEQQRQQLQTLTMLKDRIKQAHQHLDETLSALGMAYSQMLLIAENRQWRQRINRLQGDVAEEIHHLQDLIEVMDELYE